MRWHDAFRHAVALYEADSKMPAQRTSRQAAFVKVAEDQSSQLGGELAPSSKLEAGDTILVEADGVWMPALTLSVWRHYRNGNSTSQLSPVELPRGCVHSARTVLFRTGEDGTATCDADSPCFVFSLQHIGVSVEVTQREESLDGVKCKLTDTVLKALSKLNQGDNQGDEGVAAPSTPATKPCKTCKPPPHCEIAAPEDQKND